MGNVISYSCNGMGDKLLQSCVDGDVVAVRQMLQEHSRLCYWYRLNDGTTPLHVAAMNGQTQIVLRIIETASKQRMFESHRKAQMAAKAVQSMLDARNASGQSPLMLACRHGRTEVVRLLLAQGANPLFTDHSYNKTCLHYAAQAGWASCCAALLSDAMILRGSRQPLRNMEIRGRDGSMRKFIDLDAIHGYTALHIAASHGHLETTKVLLRSGASLTSECQANPRSGATAGPARGRAYIARSTPLHIAAARRNVQMCRAMLQAHALASASTEAAVGGGQPAFDIRGIRDHFDQRPVDIAEALNCPALAAMLHPNLPLALATAGHGCQGPLGPQPLKDLAAKSLRRLLTKQLQHITQQEACLAAPGRKKTAPKARQQPPCLATTGSEMQAGLFATDKGGGSGSSRRRQQQKVDLARHVDTSQSSAEADDRIAALHTTAPLPSATAPSPPEQQSLPLPPHLHECVSVAARDTQSHNPSECRIVAVSDGSRRWSAGGESASSVDPHECGICLDRASRVSIGGCGHVLCSACAGRLCVGQATTPPTCPFCRAIIGDLLPRELS